MNETADWWNKAANFFELFREGDISRHPLVVRVLIYPARVAIRAFEEFLADKCLQRASALAFASLLALVPVTATFFFFLTKLEAFGEIRVKVEDLLLDNLVPARNDVIRDYLAQYTQNVTLLGVFGIVTLFITAIFLFNTIEHTINEIWHAKQRRPFLGKLTSVWAALTAAPILICVSFYVAAKLTAGDVDIFSLKFLPHILNGLAFWFAYQYIPYTPVRIRAAVVGAIVGGTLWELAKDGFNWYIANMATFDRIYGALGAIPVFLLWLYVTWLIVLFGAEVAYAVQYPHGNRPLTIAEQRDYIEFFSVRAMAEIARRYSDMSNEETITTIDCLKDVGIPPQILGDILNRLSEKRLILYTEDQDYVPARPPSKITIREVIEAVSDSKTLVPKIGKDVISERLGKVFREVEASTESALDGLNLQALIEQGDKEPKSSGGKGG